MSTSVDTSAREYIGDILRVFGNDYDLPEGWSLPDTFLFCGAHVRRRGAYLGKTYYLQAPMYDRAGNRPAEGVIDGVQFPEQDYGTAEQVTAFLKYHGYRDNQDNTFTRGDAVIVDTTIVRVTVRFHGGGGGESAGQYTVKGFDRQGNQTFSQNRFGAYKLADVQSTLRTEFPHADLSEV